MRSQSHPDARINRMRTTVDLADDVAAAIDRERRAHGTGLSEAVNGLIRRGLQRGAKRAKFVQRTDDLRIHIDVTNVADALDHLEGPAHR